MADIRTSDRADWSAQYLWSRWKERDYMGIASYTTCRQADWFQELCHLALRKAVTTRLKRYCAKPWFGTVVDLGCATGDWSIELAEFSDRVIGVDINDSFLAIAKRQAGQSTVADRLRFESMNLVDFSDFHKADLVCFGACLTLIDDESIDEIFSNLARTAAPGALIYIRVGVACLRRKSYRSPKGNYRRRGWYTSRFRRHGFEVLDGISSSAMVAGELSREATGGNDRLSGAIGRTVHALTCAHHFVNGRNDHINWILKAA